MLPHSPTRWQCFSYNARPELTLCAVEAGPARSALALSVIGAAQGSVVAVTRVDAVRAPVARGAGCTEEEGVLVKAQH